MEDYLRNTLFVEDLLKFLFEMEGIIWEAEAGIHRFKHELGKSPFCSVIGWAVDKLCEVFHKQLEESYCSLLKEGIKDKVTFRKYALQDAIDCFSQGYTHECFLAYCVHVLGVAGIHYYPSLPDVLEGAFEVVALILFAHQMTGEFYIRGGWSGLAEVAGKIDDRISYDSIYDE